MWIGNVIPDDESPLLARRVIVLLDSWPMMAMYMVSDPDRMLGSR